MAVIGDIEVAVELKPIPPCCARCGRKLPGVESGEMVLGVPGVGTFHAACRPTWRQWLLHRAYRLLAEKPRVKAY